MFYGPMAEQMRAHNDPLWGFRPVSAALLEGDVLFGNLETPISGLCRNEPDAPDKYFGPPGIGKALKQLGYDIVNLAQNHIYDFGVEGVETTIRELDEAELPYIGIGRNADEAARPVILESPTGMRLGFLGYTTANTALDPKHAYVACFPHPSRVSNDVRNLRTQVDAVIVSCHTGSQYNPYPAPETRDLARTAIEAGASVFLAHHAHAPQGWERIGDGIAFYCLSDFVAPPHNEQTRRTFFARILLGKDCVVGQEIVPCYITDDCRTILAEGELREEIQRHIAEISQTIVDGRSDDLHFQTARGRFFSQYVRSWLRELRFGGPRVIIRKIRSLRRYHLRLVLRIIFGRMLSIGGRRRERDG
jgi:poly-gamma-glutamate synthesis protein (capsule biosynthesis protein)